jgi:copper homeostasis protein
MPIRIEVAVAGVGDAQIAEAAGADRLELCCALELGGLTPSLGTFLAIKEVVSLPVVTILRPRAGGFVYSEADVRTMERDAEIFLSHGAAGIVFGVLTDERMVDVARAARLVRLASGRETVFHRAFDLTADPMAALDSLIELGVTRVLTSGQGVDAIAGAELIGQLIERAAGRIEILPGGGITPENAAGLVAKTSANQIHGSFSEVRHDAAMPVCGGEYRGTNGRRIRAIRATLTGI